MSLQGELIVRLAWNGERVRQVAIRSTRPQASRVLRGREAGEAAGMVPLLFSICAHAQGSAASGALAAATGNHDPEATRRARDRAVLLETLQEYLRRLLIDMPVALGLEPAVEAVAAGRRLIAPVLMELAPATRSLVVRGRVPDEAQWSDLLATLARTCERAVFGMPPARWLEHDTVDALRGWMESTPTLPARMLAGWVDDDPALGASEVAPMPATSRGALEAAVADAMAAGDEFARAPDWSGTPVETGAWSRERLHPLVARWTEAFGNSVATRVVARLVEIARIVSPPGDPARLESGVADAWRAADGAGIGAVQTARGLLVHRAVVSGGRVSGYAIVAPTEWNFHPAGPLARGLARLEDRSGERLEQRSSIVIQALDPCVACTVEVARA